MAQINCQSIGTDHPETNSSLSEGFGSTPGPSFWWRAVDLGVLGTWLAVVVFALRHHEKWADEAQAWLIARDLDLPSIWLHELRYEGSPGLWHTILWVAQHVFHAPYASIGVIGMVCATAGVAFLLWKSPFPRPLLYSLIFSYFILYQYSVVARSYTLLPLLTFLVAHLFPDREHPERMTIALILLANVSAHGMILAAYLGLAYLVSVLRTWSTLDTRRRSRVVAAAATMFAVYILLFFILKPAPDVEAVQEAQQRTLSSGVSNAIDGISGAFFDSSFLTAGWLVLAIAWCWQRKKALVFAASVLALGAFYGIVHAWAHQQGAIFVAALAVLWIAWPNRSEIENFSPRQKQTHLALVTGLSCLLLYQGWNAAVIIRNDYRLPYSGAEDAAKYLKSVGADRHGIFGYMYGTVAVEAYFDHNIEANRPFAYFHHGQPFFGTRLDEAELKRVSPEYIVIPCWYDLDNFLRVYEPLMSKEGYSLAHFSDGYLLWKRGIGIRQVYFIFRKN